MFGTKYLRAFLRRERVRLETGNCLLILVPIVWSLSGEAVGAGEENARQSPDRSEWVLATEAHATIHCRGVLGLEKNRIRESSAEVVNLAEDSTPFLHGHIVGTPLWRIQGIVVASARDDSRWPKNAKESDALFHPKTKVAYRIRMFSDSQKSRTWRTPDAAESEDQMRRASNEKYIRFADSEPPVDLLTALDSVRAVGGKVDSAARVSAVCVVRETKFKPAKLVWAVTLMGVSPIRIPPLGSKGAVYTYRYIVDATTGECESFCNRPK